MHWNRRDFLRAGGLTAFGLGLNLTAPALLRRSLLAASPGDDTKLIFIFQRGGNDAVNTVIPYGDSEYNTINRPTLFIPAFGTSQNGRAPSADAVAESIPMSRRWCSDSFPSDRRSRETRIH